MLLLLLFSATSLGLRTSDMPDDAFIYLRYAENLLNGHGLVFNPDGPPVEGFSSPLFLLLLTVIIAMGVPPLVASQLCSLLPAAALVILAHLAFRRRVTAGWALLLAGALCLNPSLLTWSRGGLETALMAVLVLALYEAATRRRLGLAGVLAGVLTLTRPEGILYVGAVALFVAVRWSVKDALRMGFIAVVLGAPWLVFRWMEFGEFLPNTYYAKMDGVRAAQTARGLDYLYWFQKGPEVTPWIVLSLVGLAVLLVRPRSLNDRSLRGDGWLALAFIGCAVGFVLAAGGDHMPHARFLVPALVFIYLLGGLTVCRLAETPSRLAWRWAATVVLGVLVLAPTAKQVVHTLEEPDWPNPRPLALGELTPGKHITTFYDLGRALAQTVSPEAVIAVVPAGAIPYASGLATVDMLGLNDPEIAHTRVDGMGNGIMGHEKGRGDIVLRRRPDLILLRNYSHAIDAAPAPPRKRDLGYRPTREIWRSDELQRDYDWVSVPIDGERAFTLYRRRDSVVWK